MRGLTTENYNFYKIKLTTVWLLCNSNECLNCCLGSLTKTLVSFKQKTKKNRWFHEEYQVGDIAEKQNT